MPDQELIKKWRNGKTSLRFVDAELGVELNGVLADCILRKDDKNDVYVPLDYKTRGFDVKEEEHDQHYQLQLDCYDLLLRKNGLQTSGTGYLVYYVPDEVRENGLVQFNVQVIQFVTESDRIMNLIRDVVKVLEGKLPKAGQDCEYCAWGEAGMSLMNP